MNMINKITNFFKKIFGKTNSGVKLPKSTNGLDDIEKSCTSPRSYY